MLTSKLVRIVQTVFVLYSSLDLKLDGEVKKKKKGVVYLKGAVHQSLIEVDHHTVLAVVRDADFR